MHPVIILIAVIVVLFAVSWLQRQPPTVRKSAGMKMALTIVGVLALLGVLTGRLNPATLLVTVAAAIPLLGRVLDLKQLMDRLKSAGGPSAGQSSSVSTDFLDMTLDHDSGEMDGQVLRGRFEGRRLSSLSLGELQALMSECQSDPPSAKLLASYLQRTYANEWREHPGGGAAPSTDMTVEQAREVLGVPADATRSDIIAAHRALMQKLHPDRGGSTFLAAQVNHAKDVLLGSARS